MFIIMMILVMIISKSYKAYSVQTYSEKGHFYPFKEKRRNIDPQDPTIVMHFVNEFVLQCLNHLFMQPFKASNFQVKVQPLEHLRWMT